MPDRRPDSGPRAVPLPPDTERDTRLLFFFRPAALPWVLGALVWALTCTVLPLPTPAKLVLGIIVPVAGLGALAADAPERLALLRRYWRDGAERYAGQPTPGNVRATYPNEGTIGVVLGVLPPPSTGRGGEDLDAERAAWVHAARRLKSGRATAAITVEMVADSPPSAGWEVPPDLPLAPGYGRFSGLRQRHFEALVRDGRAMRARTLMRVAVRQGTVAGVAAELHLDRVANGVAGELQAIGVMALPLDLDLVRGMADEAPGEAEAASQSQAAEESAPQPVIGPPETMAAPADGAVSPGTTEGTADGVEEQSAPPPASRLRLPNLHSLLDRNLAVPGLLRFPALGLRVREAAESSAAMADGSPGGGPVVWPDLEALAEDAGRTWDVGLAVLGALPRVGASTALLGWAAQHRDPSRVVLVDAAMERAGGVWLASGKGATPPDGPGWMEAGDPGCRAIAPCGTIIISQGQREGEAGSDAAAVASRLMAAVRGPLRRCAGVETVIAVDLGSPAPLTADLRANPLLVMAAQEAAAIAIVTRQDAAAMYATYRLLTTLRTCGIGEIRVWVAAYDTADPLTLAEMRATLMVPVEEAPHAP